MPKTPKALSRFSIPIVVYLLLLIPASIYYFFYTQAQTEYFSARNFRQLSLMSEQLKFTLNNYKKIFKNASSEGEKAQTFLEGFVQELNHIEVTHIDDPPAKEKFEIYLENRDTSWRIVFDYSAPVTKGPGKGIRIRADRELNQMIAGFPGTEAFDDLLLASADGTIVYQSGKSGLRFTDLGGLPLAQAAKAIFAAADKSDKSSPAVKGASRLFTSVDISGKSFDIYLQPLPVAYLATKAGSAEWTLCAMVLSRRFLSESLSISFDKIILFVSISGLILLSIPFLKIGSLTGWEAFRFRDLAALLFCTCCVASLFVLLALHLYHFEIREKNNGFQLEEVANTINKEVGRELRAISLQLSKYCNSEELRQQILQHSHHRKAGWKPGNPVPVDMQMSRPLIEPDIYPTLKFVVWADSAGWQWVKWDRRRTVTPFINIDERLKGIKQGRVSRLPADEDKDYLPYRLELVYSPNTGEYIANYVVKTQECVLQEELKSDPLVANGYAYIATELRSLTRPLLPPEVGFAVIEQSGKTLLHSDPTRNQWEDFFIEADEDNILRAAVRARGVTAMNIRYHGADHEAFVTPLTALPGLPFALVVFRDLAGVRTMHLETQTLVGFMLVPYLGLLALAGLLTFYVASPAYPAAWVWPDPNRCKAYRAIILLCISLTVLASVWVIAARSPELYFSLVVIGFAASVLSILLLISGNPNTLKIQGLKIIVPLVVLLSLLLFTEWKHVILLPAGLACIFWMCTSGRAHAFMERRLRLSFISTYALAVTSLIAVIGVIPCIACFKIAHDLELELLVRSGQISIARSFRDRVAEARKAHEDLQKQRMEALQQQDDSADGPSGSPDLSQAAVSYLSSFYRTEARPNFPFQDVEREYEQSRFRQLLARQRIAFTEGVEQTSGIPLSSGSSQWRWAPGSWPVLRYRTHPPEAANDPDAVVVDTEFHPLALVSNATTGRESFADLAYWIILSAFTLTGVFFAMRYLTVKLAIPDLAAVKPVEVLSSLSASAGSNVVTKVTNNWDSAVAAFGNAVASNPQAKTLVKIFERECGSRATLSSIGEVIAGDPRLPDATPASLHYTILEHSEEHYASLWKSRSTEERFVLFHLAQDGFVNPQNTAILHALMQQGLVVSTPRFEIFNETFRRYILNHVVSEETSAWESERARQGSKSIRTMLLVLFLAFVAFLFMTRPELVQSTIGFFTALAAVAGALMKFLSSAQSGSTDQK